MSRRAPNRFSREDKHRDYGIKHWLAMKDIKDCRIQNSIKMTFLTRYGFDVDGTSNREFKWRSDLFIANRFDQFTSHAMLIIKQINSIK